MAQRAEKFREKGKDELEVQERELAELIFRLRFQLSTGQAEGLKKLREAKRDLARVKTLLRAEELRKPNGANGKRGQRTVWRGARRPAGTGGRGD